MTDWGIETGIAVAGLVLLVLLTRRAVAQQFGPRVAYALWTLPALRLIWPATVIPASWLPSGLRPQKPAETADPVQFIAPTLGQIDTLPAAEAPQPFSWLEALSTSLPALWIAGVIIGSTWVIYRHARYAAHLKSTTVGLDPTLRREADRAARLAGLKSTPKLCVSLVDDGPSVTGLIQPIIVLPSAFTERFTPQQRQLALIHEMSHIKRGDLWSATAMMGFRIINWPNPLIHLAWPAFRADQEAACDATVLRCVGETERATYAETLLTAATTHSGRASPATGAGLSLSLHHPVKERLMTLGMNTKRHTLARAGLATLLLTGAALTAPLSLADDPEKTTEKDSVAVFIDSLDLRDLSDSDMTTEKRTFVFTNRDGTSGTMTLKELLEEYGDDLPEGFSENLAGEPGLKALNGSTSLSKFISVSRFEDDDNSYEIRKENGETRAFRIEDDGTRTEIDPSEVKGLTVMEGLDGLDALDLEGKITVDGFPSIRLKTDRFFDSKDGESEARVRVFGLQDGEFPQGFTFDTSNATDIRLKSAESMIESSARQIERLRETDEGQSDRDLREAERELKKAQKALEKAQEAMKRRDAE